MEDLRRLKGRLEGAMKITEGELQKSVFKCVRVVPSFFVLLVDVLTSP
jgi:hypothetical protein